jgi:hypothetical protein
MNTPTKAQLNDPKWWDEHAPVDAEIVWLVWNGAPRIGSLHRIAWAKFGEGIVTGQDQCTEYHHRPTKPAAPEWDGEHRPAITEKCEVQLVEIWPGYPAGIGLGSPVTWKPCVVVGYDGEKIVVKEGERFLAVKQTELRPHRTKEQREREEAIKAAKSVIKDALTVNQLDDDTERGLEALYDAGMLRKAGEK